VKKSVCKQLEQHCDTSGIEISLGLFIPSGRCSAYLIKIGEMHSNKLNNYRTKEENNALVKPNSPQPPHMSDTRSDVNEFLVSPQEGKR
jgi:hypothetical protein